MPVRPQVLLLCLVFVSTGAVFKASAQQLSVDEAVRLGLEHNAQIRASEAGVDEADAARRVARAALLPSVEARASYLRLSDNIPEAEFSLPGFDTTFTLLPVERNRYHSELSLEQPLFAGGRIINQVRAARLQADAATLAAQQDAADVAFEIRQAYWRLYESMASVQAIEASIAQVEGHLRVVESRVREGVSLRAELLSARTRRSEMVLNRIDAVNAVDLARIDLNRLIGRPLGAPIETVSHDPGETPMPADYAIEQEIAQYIADHIESHPSIESLERQVQALEAVHRATRGAWLPEVAAVARYVYARPNQYFFLEQDEFKASWEAGVSMRWSLLDGGRRSAETMQARARINQSQARLDDLRGRLEMLLTQRRMEVERATEFVAVAEEAVEAAEEALRVTRVSYVEGVILGSDVLEAEQAYHNARMRLARATADRYVADASILNALGRVW
jgi:outer membrane protein